VHENQAVPIAVANLLSFQLTYQNFFLIPAGPRSIFGHGRFVAPLARAYCFLLVIYKLIWSKASPKILSAQINDPPLFCELAQIKLLPGHNQGHSGEITARNYAGSSAALLAKQLHFETRAREFISTFDALARCTSNFIKMKLQNIPT
jgi:hypothetical protein